MHSILVQSLNSAGIVDASADDSDASDTEPEAEDQSLAEPPSHQVDELPQEAALDSTDRNDALISVDDEKENQSFTSIVLILGHIIAVRLVHRWLFIHYTLSFKHLEY